MQARRLLLTGLLCVRRAACLSPFYEIRSVSQPDEALVITAANAGLMPRARFQGDYTPWKVTFDSDTIVHGNHDYFGSDRYLCYLNNGSVNKLGSCATNNSKLGVIRQMLHKGHTILMLSDNRVLHRNGYDMEADMYTLTADPLSNIKDNSHLFDIIRYDLGKPTSINHVPITDKKAKELITKGSKAPASKKNTTPSKPKSAPKKIASKTTKEEN